MKNILALFLLIASLSVNAQSINTISADRFIGGTFNGTTLAGTGPIQTTGVGLNVIGGTALTGVQWLLTGTFPGQTGFEESTTLQPGANVSSYGMYLAPTITKNAAGVHVDFASLQIDPPIIIAGASTITNATTLKITGPGTGATLALNNKSLWIPSGSVEFTAAVPHAIGGPLVAGSQLAIGNGGSVFSGNIALDLESTLALALNVSAEGSYLGPSFNTNVAGTHADLYGTYIAAPIINSNGAAITRSTSLYVASAPALGTTKRAFWVAAGASSLDGTLTLPGLSTSSAATTGTMCWTTGTGNVNIDTTTTCLLSSAKYKQDEKPLNVGLRQVLALRPVSYTLREQFNPAHLGEQIGFFAEDVAKVEPRLVSLEDDGTPHAVRYQQLTAVLTKAIQEQQAEIKRLSRRITTLEKQTIH